MKSIRVVSSKRNIGKIIGIIAIILFISSFMFARGDFSILNPYMLLIVISVVVPSTPFIWLSIGRNVEVSESGLSLGKRYQGPYSSSSRVNPYSFFLKSTKNLIIPWGNIHEISFGTWERFWARHGDILTSVITGDIADATLPQQVAQVFGIPAIKWRAWHLIIQTKNNEFYSIELNKNMAMAAQKAITKFGHKELVNTQEQVL